jgi:hypothetical protein
LERSEQVSLLSKRRPKHLVSETILIGELYNFNSGSGWSPLLLQKCIPRVFELENYLMSELIQPILTFRNKRWEFPREASSLLHYSVLK